MANNRLFIRDTETGDELCIAKSIGGGWYPSNDYNLLEEWLKGRDLEESTGNARKTTGSKFVITTENSPNTHSCL